MEKLKWNTKKYTMNWEGSKRVIEVEKQIGQKKIKSYMLDLNTISVFALSRCSLIVLFKVQRYLDRIKKQDSTCTVFKKCTLNRNTRIA